MSYSSIYGIKPDYTGCVISEYGNSWLFSPIIWDVLCEKYIPNEINTPYGYEKSIIGNGSEIFMILNDKMNRCYSTSDRICWELSNQQIFFTKDKEIISKSIIHFLEENRRFSKYGESGYPLEMKHIIERFKQIADDILSLDEIEYPCFVFKNTSVDCGVVRWFTKYNEEKEKYEDASIKDCKEFITEFVVIEEGKIKEFVSNLEYGF